MNNKARFYVYEWYNKNTNEVFYVGKGTGKRYLETRHRNLKFIDYIENNDVDVRIIQDNLTEEQAFALEKEITEQYKKIGQCQCSLAAGGSGGCSSVWTEEFRQYWSEYNPMKSKEQRQRMKDNNPMKDKEIAIKNGKTHKRAVYIDNNYFEGVIDAAQFYGVRDVTVTAWCKRGYNTEGKPCHYADEEQKEYVIPNRGKGVIIDGKDYYPTVKAAAEALGSKDASPLCKALKLKKLYKGHICEYANQQPTR